MLAQWNCPCCREFLHHCERCWNRFHNGEKDKDYEPPEYYGQPLDKSEDDKIRKEVCKMTGKEYNPKFKPDKNRKYEEGDYHH